MRFIFASNGIMANTRKVNKEYLDFRYYEEAKEEHAAFTFRAVGGGLTTISRIHGSKFLNVISNHPLPIVDRDYKYNELSDLILERANFLMKKNKKIHVMWSGGVDSTSMLVAFMMNGIKPDQLNILYAPISAERENPEFYKKFITGKFNEPSSFLAPHNYVKTLDYKDSIVVSGDPCDIYFIPPKLKDFLSVEYRMKPWHEFKYLSRKYMPWYEQLVKESPYEVKTIDDWFWYQSFVHKYLLIGLRGYALLADNEYDNRDIYFPFYMTEDFEKWSICNYRQAASIPNHHRGPLHKFIYDFDNNEEYFKNKGKRSSMTEAFFNSTDHFYFIDENYNRVEAEISE